MSTSPTTESISPETKAICACHNKGGGEYLKKAWAACAGDAVYEHEGKRYCVMHYPSTDKANAFWNELEKKIDTADYNFCGVYFPEGISFSGYKKSNEERFCFTTDANFDFATFNGEADFSYVTFNGEASFTNATFSNLAAFGFVIFSGAADFAFAAFNGFTLFRATKFKKQVWFFAAQFKDYVKFWRGDEEMFGAEVSLTFDSLRIEKPERLSFHSVNLRPHWFINTDPRKFEFIDVNWGNIAKELKSELASTQEWLKQKSSTSAHRLLSIAYRQLAVNAEENNRYDEAAKFRYNSMDLRRLEKANGKAFWTLDWWYWYLSRYGEDVWIAFARLLMILLLFCLPYWFVGFAPTKDGENLVHVRGLASAIYSLETALLQKPEPRPKTTTARIFVGLEIALAPL